MTSDPNRTAPDLPPVRGLALRRLDHVGVVVEDLAVASGLLRNLGLDPGPTARGPEIDVAFFDCGESSVELISIREDPADDQPGEASRVPTVHIAFEVERLDEAHAALTRLGIETTWPARDTPTGRSLWSMPATTGGIMMQFIERGSSG